MLNFTQTDIFQFFESSGAGMARRMKEIVSNPKAAVILNAHMENVLTKFTATFKEPIAMKAALAIRRGEMICFYAKPETNLPECIPYFRYTGQSGQAKVAINLTGIVINFDATDTTNIYVDIEDMRKFYAVVISAYINLVIPDASHFPVKSMEYGAMMWAKMWCKILNTTIGLAQSRDRYTAFFYYAVRFYLTYYIQAPEATVDSISNAVLKGSPMNSYITAISDALADPEKAKKFYGSFTGFCDVMFDNEITNTKAMRIGIGSNNDKLNVSLYLRRFMDAYYQSAIMSLASPHYFTWVLLCVQKRAFMVNIKMLGTVFESTTELPKYFAALYTEAEKK